MAKYKAAIIGLGRIASTIDDEVEGSSYLLPWGHMPSYLQVPEIEVVAAADSYAEQRETFGSRYGLSNLYADYREMIEKERPDIVSVCISTKPRAEVVTAIAAMGTGVKAIWTEKPIATSLAEADSMVAACRSAGIKLAINCLRRWDPWYNKVREMIDSGAIGRVHQVNVYASGEFSHYSHAINLARYLAGGNGRVSWVFGEMESEEKAGSDDDLGGYGYLAFDNGVRGFLRVADLESKTWLYNESDVLGSDGRIKIPADWEFELWQRADGDRRMQLCRYYFPRPQRIESAGVRTVRDLVQCIETGKEPNSSGDDGLHDLEVAIALRESHRQGGRRVDLPIADRAQRIISAEDIWFQVPRALAGERPP